MEKKINVFSEQEYWFWYCGLSQIPLPVRERLLQRLGTPAEIFHASEKALRDVLRPAGQPGGQMEPMGDTDEADVFYNRKILERAVRDIREGRETDKIQRMLETMNQRGILFIPLCDENYPKRLLSIPGRPLGLFIKGGLPSDDRPSAAIVGSRNCSYYGRSMAEDLGKALAEAGIQVISGLARGIDAAGHRGALRAENRVAGTFGVLGCGPDMVYPRENQSLYGEVEAAGGLISEYPTGTRPLPMNFPARNRIISGLSDCVAIIEAGKRSGSLITASYALEQGKEIWAVPGRAGDYLSCGTNSLLKDGAELLTEPEDILSFWNLKGKKLRISNNNQLSLDKNLERVYSCLDSEPKSTERICLETGLNSADLAVCLVDLEMEGLVVQPYEHYYVAKRDKGEHYGKVSGHCRVPRKSKDN
ncbi:DNA-processing protein DprA [Lacrimispora sp. NSJ-141]|uniref:DNA-processing protein DprA n=1 Tax=Lientehia hominis TaxID=2897778 RepID=A0AAP2RIK8_9FIRM|nr:DNA-processing protein DprA [Lientehia hominis]MCD2492396.1 DNA-processing protein DprA [Lientehia hominis]